MIVLYNNKTRDEVDGIIYSIIKLTVIVQVTAIRRIQGGADPNWGFFPEVGSFS